MAFVCIVGITMETDHSRQQQRTASSVWLPPSSAVPDFKHDGRGTEWMAGQGIRMLQRPHEHAVRVVLSTLHDVWQRQKVGRISADVLPFGLFLRTLYPLYATQDHARKIRHWGNFTFLFFVSKKEFCFIGRHNEWRALCVLLWRLCQLPSQ